MILYLPLEMSVFYMKGSMPEIAMTDIMPSGWILDSDRFDRTPEVVPAIELVHYYKWIHFILYLKWAASAGCRHLNIMNKWNTRLGWYAWEGFSHFGTVVKLRLRASIEPWLPFFFFKLNQNQNQNTLLISGGNWFCSNALCKVEMWMREWECVIGGAKKLHTS